MNQKDNGQIKITTPLALARAKKEIAIEISLVAFKKYQAYIFVFPIKTLYLVLMLMFRLFGERVLVRIILFLISLS